MSMKKRFSGLQHPKKTSANKTSTKTLNRNNTGSRDTKHRDTGNHRLHDHSTRINAQTRLPAKISSTPALLLFNKPYEVLCQFTDTDKNRLNLSSFIHYPHFYPAGRLDFDSEGLLLLTNSGSIQHQIQHPAQYTTKQYWAQVEGEISDSDLAPLSKGIVLRDGLTLPAFAERIPEPMLWERTPPIRTRKNIPTSWINIQMREGKNRQVRRMLAHIGFPVLRLVRHQIGEWKLENLQPGEHLLIQDLTKIANSFIRQSNFHQ